MHLSIIGWLHALHSPFLILYPVFLSSIFWDIIYINYFFIIMFSYTFIQGECPISYACKKMLDGNYISGQNLSYYPEMLKVFPNEKTVQRFLFFTTTLYICSLLYVINRSKIPLYNLVFPFLIIFIYFLFARISFLSKNAKVFALVQEITKCSCLLAIFYIANKN
jgi:hypothetical protein